MDDVDAGWNTPALRFYEVAPENYMRRGGSYPAALSRIAERHALLTHGLMLDIGGADDLDTDYLHSLREFLRQLGAERHTDHLCWTRRDGRYLHDLLPLPCDRQTVQRVADRVRRVQDVLGVPMALENISYYGAPASATAERDFVCEVLERADCGLLLDVNNVYCNAHNHGFEPLEYLGALPLHRVVQLHVAGGERRPRLHDMLIDTHGADVPPAVAELMAWVIERVGPMPVLYERDHDIPPVAVLGEQIEALDRVYQRALQEHERWREASVRRAEAVGVPPSVEKDSSASGNGAPGPQITEHLGGYQTGMASLLLAEHDATVSSQAIADQLASIPTLRPDERDLVASVGAKPLSVYRALVRGSLTSVIDTFLARTRARMGEAFESFKAQWLAGPGACSPCLADVPHEFFAWAKPLWRHDSQVPPYLIDLAQHELTEYEVGAAPSPPRTVTQAGFSLDSRLAFDSSVRLRHYAFAVHELSLDEDDRTEPPQRETRLLAHRGSDYEVRYLVLSAIAMAWLTRLMAGESVEPALRNACLDSGEALDDALLARMSQLLADLVERGVVLGVAETVG